MNKNNYSLIFVFYSLFIIFASPYKVNKHFQITVIYQKSKSICLKSFSQKIPYDTWVTYGIIFLYPDSLLAILCLLTGLHLFS